MTLPNFPEFKDLGLEDKKFFDIYVRDHEPYSDFNFTSLWGYDIDNSAQISMLNGNLVIKMRDYLEDFYFLTFLGQNEIVDTMETLIGHASKCGLYPKLKLVPEHNFGDNISGIANDFIIEEDRDHFDYVLSVNDTISLKGNKYKKIRKKVTKFITAFPEYEVRVLDLNLNSSKKDVEDTFVRWAKGRDERETVTEYKATRKIMENSNYLDIVCLGLYVNDRITGYTISEVLHGEYCLGLFGSYDYDYDGVLQVIEIETLRLFKKMGCSYINIEQDLGIANLRKSKEAWQPERFLKKYVVSRK